MKNIYQLTAIILLAGLSYFAGCMHKKNKEQHSAFPKALPTQTEAAKVNTYRDSNGRQHTVFAPQPSITRAEALKQTSVLVPYIDSIALALKVKSKQIESSTTISTNVSADSIQFLKSQVDSLKRLVYFYNDKYLKLTVRTGNPTDTLDKGSFDFSYDADLNINQYYKRKKVIGLPIGSKQHFTDISSNDPRTTIGGLKTITVKQNLPQFGFRLQALMNYNFNSNSFSPGVGFRFDANKLSLNGIYYYNTMQKEWRPVLSLKYDIIQF